MKRIEQRNYPPDAIREDLLNAVMHRDCSYSGSILVSIFNDRIELVSLGELTKGIAYSDLLLGVSVSRNIRLAEIFYHLGLIEAYGTGVPKTMDYYKAYGIHPGIEMSDIAFKITLPNTNIISTEEDTDEFLSSDEQIV